MTTYYNNIIEETQILAQITGGTPGGWYDGIVLRSGRRGFAAYKERMVVGQYTVRGKIC